MSDAARASLLAVQAAQAAARARTRRDSMRTRAWVVGVLGLAALGVFVLGSRSKRHDPPAGPVGRTAPAVTAPVASVSLASGSSVAPAAPAPGPGRVESEAAATRAGGLTIDPSSSGPSSPGAIGAGSATPQAIASTAATATAPDTAAEAACAEAFAERRWRLSLEPCVKAFEARPTDAALALRVAQAHHARSRLPEAGEWARRALDLDPRLAEAFVILAHAESRAGHPAAALEAYRHYLTLAPRGWHASEARSALRERTRPPAHARASRRSRRHPENADASSTLPEAPALKESSPAVSVASDGQTD